MLAIVKPCKTEDKLRGNCRRPTTVYTSECTICLQRGLNCQYIAESSRSLAERSSEHDSDVLTNKPESHMAYHRDEHHQELTLAEMSANFRIYPLRNHSSSFLRQLHEACAISCFKGSKILNVKEEYSRCVIPQLSVNLRPPRAMSPSRASRINSKINKI